MTVEQLVQAFGQVAQDNRTVAVTVLIVANFVLGVIVALKDGKFELPELSGILTRVLKYVPLYLGIGTVSNAIDTTTSEVLNWVGTLTASAPFAVGSVKNVAEWLPDWVKEEVPGWVVGRSTRKAWLGNIVFKQWKAGTFNDDQAAREAAAIEQEFKDVDPHFPPGWPSKPQ